MTIDIKKITYMTDIPNHERSIATVVWATTFTQTFAPSYNKSNVVNYDVPNPSESFYIIYTTPKLGCSINNREF